MIHRIFIVRLIEIEAVGGEVDAGQHDLVIAATGEIRDLLHRVLDGTRADAPTHVWDDAVGTELIAAILHLDEGPSLIGDLTGSELRVRLWLCDIRHEAGGVRSVRLRLVDHCSPVGGSVR